MKKDDLTRVGEQMLAHYIEQHGSESGAEKVFSKCSVGHVNGSDLNGSKRIRSSGQKAENDAARAAKRSAGAGIA